MIDFSNSIKLSSREILEKVSQLEIYEHYLNSSIVENKLYRCCFHDDHKPSLGFRTMESGKMIFNCFACGTKGDVFNFVKDIHKTNSYSECLSIIQKDLNLINTPIGNKYQPLLKKAISVKNTSIIPTFKPFTKTDFDYWNKYSIPLELCLRFNVRACKLVYLVNREGYHRISSYYSNINPIYSYQIKDRFKIYRPYANKEDKWKSNTDNTCIQGYEQLSDKGELLIITSSMKDLLVLTVMGYNAIAPNSEAASIPDEIIENLYNRFDNIVVFYDNDTAGLTLGKKLSNNIGSGNIFIPNDYDTKDISDFVDKYSLEEGEQLMKKLI